MRQSRVKSAFIKWLERRTVGKRILGILRYLKLADEPWMVTRRQMQGLHALITAHHLTSKQFKSLLGKDDDCYFEQHTDIASGGDTILDFGVDEVIAAVDAYPTGKKPVSTCGKEILASA